MVIPGKYSKNKVVNFAWGQEVTKALALDECVRRWIWVVQRCWGGLPLQIGFPCFVHKDFFQEYCSFLSHQSFSLQSPGPHRALIFTWRNDKLLSLPSALAFSRRLFFTFLMGSCYTWICCGHLGLSVCEYKLPPFSVEILKGNLTSGPEVIVPLPVMLACSFCANWNTSLPISVLTVFSPKFIFLSYIKH